MCRYNCESLCNFDLCKMLYETRKISDRDLYNLLYKNEFLKKEIFWNLLRNQKDTNTPWPASKFKVGLGKTSKDFDASRKGPNPFWKKYIKYLKIF